MSWTCKACALAAGADLTGRTTAARGWCAAGSHAVREQIAFVPDLASLPALARPATPIPDPPPPVVSVSSQPPRQLSMF